MLWDQKLHTAEVRAVYNSGKVGVVYDVDATVGYLLSVLSRARVGGYYFTLLIWMLKQISAVKIAFALYIR